MAEPIASPDDYASLSEEERVEFLAKDTSPPVKHIELAMTTAVMMEAVMDLIEALKQLPNHTPESLARVLECVQSVRKMHRILIVNSGISPEEKAIYLEQNQKSGR